jgi:hypothetical protein
MLLIVIIIFWSIVLVGLLGYTLISEYKDWRRKKTMEANLEYPPKTPIKLFAVKHVLHWKLEGDDFDMGKVKEAKKECIRWLNATIYKEPGLESIVVVSPEDLNKWRDKFRTLGDMKAWIKEQDEILAEYIKIKEGNFE